MSVNPLYNVFIIVMRVCKYLFSDCGRLRTWFVLFSKYDILLVTFISNIFCINIIVNKLQFFHYFFFFINCYIYLN